MSPLPPPPPTPPPPDDQFDDQIAPNDYLTPYNPNCYCFWCTECYNEDSISTSLCENDH